MDKKYLILLSILSLLLFAHCASDDPEGKDTIPPSKVILTPHLGDAGDPGTSLTDYNNGIDATDSAENQIYNWMKIQWDNTPLIQDTDISHIEIYRFPDFDTTNITYAGSMEFVTDSSRFIDKFEGVETITPKTWSYFIIPYDHAGNYTKSDTVHYSLLDKPDILYPEKDAQFSSDEDINFRWEEIPMSTYRILFFDQNHNLIATVNDCNDNNFTTSSNVLGLIPTTYIWRVDAFGSPQEEWGSESNERTIIFSNK
ncbi:MAG: hypothetical protein KGY75_04150 [Candidatus Cloacimonetes bacterium]|nr:hypothetical protein [Candidatus Cloacimonadota bacterium]